MFDLIGGYDPNGGFYIDTGNDWGGANRGNPNLNPFTGLPYQPYTNTGNQQILILALIVVAAVLLLRK